MFDGLTMVSYDGHNRNKMMVDHVWTMVDHGRPWSGGQMFAGVGFMFLRSGLLRIKKTITKVIHDCTKIHFPQF